MLYNHQRNYSFFPKTGAPGRIVDLAPYAVDAFINGEDTGVMELGMGVVLKTGAEKTILKPGSTGAGTVFAGIVVNGGTEEHGLENENYVRNTKALGVMRYGRIYARVKTGLTIANGDPVYLITEGDNAGLFTNVATDNTAVAGRFLSAADEKGRGVTSSDAVAVAVVELFNSAQPAAEDDGNG